MTRIVILATIAVIVYLSLVGPRRRARVVSGPWPRIALAVAVAFVYLRSPVDLIPDGSLIGVLDDLLFAIALLWWALQRGRDPAPSRRQHEERTTAKDRSVRWDPHAVLGVRRGASREEIAGAYRERMKLYHPDRVNGLGEELQRLAHEKTLEIQRAYEELRGRR